MELVSHVVKRKQSDHTPIIIAPIGDIQYAGKRGATAMDALKQHIDKCMDMGAWFIGLGDYIDFMCVELDAEILTKTGWRRHDQVTPGDIVAAYDGSNIVWTPLLDVQHFDDAPVVEVSSKSFNARVTSNHQWMTTKGLKPTLGMNDHAYNLVVAAPAVSGDHHLTPDEAWLIGWLISDGHIRWRTTDNFSVLQTKPQYVEELRVRLAGMIRHEGVNQAGCHCFDLHVDAVRAVFWRAGVDYKTLEGLTSLPLSLSQPARAAMLDALLKAEGSFHASDPSRQGNWRFAQSIKMNPLVCETFQNLCVMEGLRLGISKPKTSGVWTPRILTRAQPTTYDMRIRPIGTRPVWCPTTAFGTWVMRQGQQITITGNSPSNRQRLRSADLYDTAMDVVDEKALELVEELYDQVLKPTRGRWIGLLEGHHFTQLKTGETTDQRLCQLLNTSFLGTSTLIRLQVEYAATMRCNIVLWAHHGAGGGAKACAPLNKLENLSPYWGGVDVFLMAHTTKSPVVPINRVEARWSGHGSPDLVHKKVYFVSTGGFCKAYIQGARDGNIPRGGYAEKGVMNPAVIGAPIIKITPQMKWETINGKASRQWSPVVSVEV